MEKIPEDAMMLLSFVNLKLRDYYKDIDEMCEDLGVCKDKIIEKLSSIDYEYDEGLNRFV
ncbi:MAG: DUF4250 domain-containing protein [Lachnospiraceae bacterium]|nr:DUF4250 domain-containing protein [Lachnospiraceae bacterium]